MNQLVLIIGSLMAVVMLVVLGLLDRRKATLRVARPLLALVGISFAMFSYGVMHTVFWKSSSPLIALIFGFIFAIAAGAVFLWQRSRIS